MTSAYRLGAGRVRGAALAATACVVLAGASMVPAPAMPAQAVEGLTLQTAMFTGAVENNQPGKEVTGHFPSRPGGLWFFSAVKCGGGCIEFLRSQGQIELAHYWCHRVGNQWIERLPVRHTMTRVPRRDTGYRFPSRKETLPRGRYRVVVKGENEALCLDSGVCEFFIEVE